MAGWELNDPNNIPTFSFLLPGSCRFLQTAVLFFSKLFWDKKKTHFRIFGCFLFIFYQYGVVWGWQQKQDFLGSLPCPASDRLFKRLGTQRFSVLLLSDTFQLFSSNSRATFQYSALLSTAFHWEYFSAFQFSVLLFRTQRFSALFLNLLVCAGHGHGLGIDLSAIMWITLANLYVCQPVTSLLPKVSSEWCDRETQ